MNSKRKSPSRQLGLTLIEILLVLGLGVIVTGAVLSMRTMVVCVVSTLCWRSTERYWIVVVPSCVMANGAV